MTTYGFDEEASVEPGELLGNVVQERIRILQLQHEGHHSEAGEVADDLLRQLNDWLPAGGAAELDSPQVPHAVQSVALLLDSSFSALLAGDPAGAATRLRALAHFSPQLEGLADRIAGMAMLHCAHGRPSLDGECTQVPPCP
jgi:hypothetical protein